MNNDRTAAAPLALPGRRHGSSRGFPLRAIVVGTALLLAAQPAIAQSAGGRSEVFAGSEFESYLRYLQTLGKSPSTTWSIRGFSPAEIDALAPADSIHPWGDRYAFRKEPRQPGLTIDYVRPTVGVIVNSAFPFGSNDGIVWAGKGLTSWAQAGVAVRWGPVSASVAPVAFRAENQSFPMMENGLAGNLAFADGQFPLEIDRPQRFGEGPYTRIDPGESTLRVDAGGVAIGISSASQWWGPTTEYPYILGNNAGGFPHLFFGTSKPAGIGIGSVHGRVEYGYLRQSAYSSVVGQNYFESYVSPGKLRFMAGLIGVATIRGIRGLEIGGARFFHAATDSSGLQGADIRLPLQNFLKSRIRAEGDTVFGDDRSLQQNQLASIFFRWAPPSSGLELYGEYGREDFSADLRDFMLEPDHSSTVNLGFRKAWLKGTRMNAVRAEFFSFQVPAGTRTRGEGLIYLHQPLRQGHTVRGQMLGANTGAGSGSAQFFAFERYTTGGRLKGFVSRVTQREISARAPWYVSGPPAENPSDVQYSMGAEVSRFVGPFDFTARGVLTSNANRYFKDNQSNANLALVIRQGF